MAGVHYLSRQCGGILAARGARTVVVTAGDRFFQQRISTLGLLVVALAARHRLPVIYPWEQYSEIGGLMSYGPDLRKAYHLIGLYAGRILRGKIRAN